LTDRRFEDLLQQASAFFAQEERDPEADKQAAIAEIIETMNRYGITVKDLGATE
jgi:DNA-binding protein H-NS